MWMILRTVDMLFEVLYWLIIIRIILSWVIRDPYNKYYAMLGQITEPILAPFRNLLNRLGAGRTGLDFSPIVALLALRFLKSIIINLLISIGY
ncbi:MAG: YggT family protein [Clostridia bacterium]|nr:YggT family protein [Clostridia bacterium]